jgi:hypothetical protein
MSQCLLVNYRLLVQRRWLLIGLLVCGPLLGFISRVSRADEAAHPLLSAEQLLDEETLAILELDVEAIRPRAIWDWAESHVLMSNPPPAAFVSMAEATLASLRAAGTRQVIVMISTRNLIHGGMLLIPCQESEGIHAMLSLLSQQLPERYGFRVQRREGLVGLATDVAWRRLEEQLSDNPSDARVRPENRFPGLSDERILPHRVTVSLPARHREELIALWPDKLPLPMPVPFSPRQWTQDADSISLAWQLPPEPEISLQVRARDAVSAERLRDSLNQVVGMLPQGLDPISVEIQEQTVVAHVSPERLLALVTNLSAMDLGSQVTVSNQLKQIGLAMHNYHDTYEHWPPRATVTPEGKELLSWRVHLLPYLEQQAMYNQFRLDEPWDSPANRPLGAIVIPTFTGSGDTLPPGYTRIRLPQIEGSFWQGAGPPRTIRDVTDGVSNTIGAAIAPPDKSVPWTQPEPWELDADDLIGSFFGDAEEVLVLMLDGSVRKLHRDMGSEALRALLTHAGGERSP